MPDKPKEQPLTQKLNGLRAAAGEERIGRALNKKIKAGSVRGFYFRSSPGLPKGVPGWKELDFEIWGLGVHIAVSVQDTTFVHHTEAQKNQDRLNDIFIMAQLAELGRPVEKIFVIDEKDLTTQDDAEKQLKKIGIR